MITYVLFSMSTPKYAVDIRRFIKQARHCLPCSPENVEIIFRDSLILAFWRNKNLEPHFSRVNPGAINSANGATAICSGYAARGVLDGTSPSFFGLCDDSDEKFLLKNSPGGIGSWVFLSDSGSTAYAWSTQPPAMTTWYGANRRGFSVVSNRPKLAFAASVLSDTLILKEEGYIADYLTSCYSVRGLSPYKGIRALRSGHMLRVTNGRVEDVRGPLLPRERIPADRPLFEKSEELADLLVAATWPLSQCQEPFIFMSGGKDSRTILSAMLASLTKFRPFSFGVTGAQETEVASEVVKASGMALQVMPMNIISDPRKAAAYHLERTDGLGLNFPHQVEFCYPLRFLEGRPSAHGHGHLLRGGNARTMSKDIHAACNQLRNGTISEYVSDDTSLPNRLALEEWIERTLEVHRDPREMLFHAHADQRLWSFTNANILEMYADAFMVYPLLDERVARFAAALTAYDRISERVAFGAITLLSKEISNIPLFDNIWRFDRSPGKKDFLDGAYNFSDGFLARQPRSLDRGVFRRASETAFSYDADRLEFPSKSDAIAQAIIEASSWPSVSDMLSPEFAKAIRLGNVFDTSHSRDVAIANKRHVRNAFPWRVLVAAMM